MQAMQVNYKPHVTEFIKTKVGNKSKVGAAKYMAHKEMKEKILQKWELPHIKITRNLVSAACDYQRYCCDVFNGVRVGEDAKYNTEVVINIDGSDRSIILTKKEGLAQCKETFGTFENFVSSCEDMRVFELLAIKINGKYRIDSFKGSPKEMSLLFFTVGAYFFVEQIWDLI